MHILTWKEVGSLLTEYSKSFRMMGGIMHIISSGYPWGIFLCGLTFFFEMNVFHFCYLKNNKSKHMIVQF